MEKATNPKPQGSPQERAKFGEWAEVVELAYHEDAQYEFKELFEWLKDSKPILSRKPQEPKGKDKVNGHANGHANGHGGENPFLDFAKDASGPSIDVEARLAAMTYQGPGDGSIHSTQLEVSASLLSRGIPIMSSAPSSMPHAKPQAQPAISGTGARNAAISAKCAKAGWQSIPTFKERKQQDTDNAKEAPEPEATIQPETKTKRWNWHFHGDPEVKEVREEIIVGLMPTVGTGLMPGQWGTYKTFVALDLAGSIMSGTTFIEYPVHHRAGVAFIACEGENEIPIRLKAVVEKICGSGKAPFVWISECPPLMNPKNAPIIIEMLKEASDRMMEDFGLTIGLVIIDTSSKAAGYTKPGDDSDPVIGQFVIQTMETVAKGIKAFVLGVAHFGKDVTTGTRGALSKEDSTDLILPTLGERDLAGNVANPRLAIRKRRSGPVGIEYPFTTELVEVGVNENGEPITTLTINWSAPTTPETPTKEKSGWIRPLKPLRNALVNSLASGGLEQRPSPDSPMVRAVNLDTVRLEFYRTYIAEGETELQRKEARKKAFQRAIGKAQELALVGVHVGDDRTLVWLTSDPCEKV